MDARICLLAIESNSICLNILLLLLISSSIGMDLIFPPFTHRSSGRSPPTLPLDTSFQKMKRDEPFVHSHSRCYCFYAWMLVIMMITCRWIFCNSIPKNERIWSSKELISIDGEEQKNTFGVACNGSKASDFASSDLIWSRSDQWSIRSVIESISETSKARVVHLHHSFVCSAHWPTTIVLRVCRSTKKASERTSRDAKRKARKRERENNYRVIARLDYDESE